VYTARLCIFIRQMAALCGRRISPVHSVKLNCTVLCVRIVYLVEGGLDGGVRVVGWRGDLHV